MVEVLERELQATYQLHVESLVREQVFPSAPSDAELFATRVDLEWHFTEIADAVRKRAALWDRGEPILLVLAGVGALTDGQLVMLGEDLGAIIGRGTEQDSLLINWRS